MSPSIPLVWVSRCATVTWSARSAAPSRRPGSAWATVVSRDSSPASISCMIMVAVHNLVIDPTWNTESVLTCTRVARLRTPQAARISCPPAQMPSTAPGTRACRASSPRRVVQFAASSMFSTLTHSSGPVLWPFRQGFVTYWRGSVIIACRRLWWIGDGSPGRPGVVSLARPGIATSCGGSMSIMGTRVIRTEDPRLLTAGGVYVDDLRTPELNAAARLTFVRSPVAHARITGIDTSEALSEPGVIAVLTVRDMDDLAPPPPSSGEWDGSPAPLGGPWAEPLLAVDTVRFVGEPVAVVITDGRYQGEDAADLVSVDYDPLPVVLGPAAAVAEETLLFPAAGTNVCVSQAVSADDTPFDACDVIVEQDIVIQRVACLPMEGRATAAAYENGKLTVWASSQNAQVSRFILAGALGMAPDQIRVVVPDVGGGFGAKIGIDRDTITLAWAARKTGRALRWAETRSENLVAMTQGRAQLQRIKIGGSRDGSILAYRIDVIQDIGAYARIGGLLPFFTCLMAPGVYDIPDVQAGFRQAFTNTTPISAYRGAGRPEATAAVERAVDLFAAEIGMDPAEVRRRNFIAPDKFPFQTKTGAMY